jgi:4-nitrophenyl phosphatase
VKIIATDLDGTLFKGETLINGVKESILELKNNNIEIYYTTNNSSQSPSEIREKLVSLLNLEIDINKIITPLIICKDFFSKKFDKLYIYGTDEIKKYIETLNIETVSLDKSEAILIGRKEINDDHEIEDIISLVRSGMKIYCLNKDLTYPTELGEQPGNGAVVKIIEDELSINIQSLGKSGELYPSYFINNEIRIEYVIGDRVDTDIMFGKYLDAVTFLVSSGVDNFLDTKLADYQLSKFSEIVPFIIKNS